MGLKKFQKMKFQAYCKIIEERLLPWLFEQLGKFPQRLKMRFSKRVHFSQVLHSIRPGVGYVDLELKSGNRSSTAQEERNEHVVITSSPHSSLQMTTSMTARSG